MQKSEQSFQYLPPKLDQFTFRSQNKKWQVTASEIQRMIYGIVENKSLYKGVFVV